MLPNGGGGGGGGDVNGALQYDLFKKLNYLLRYFCLGYRLVFSARY